jgi:hypothetical protein
LPSPRQTAGPLYVVDNKASTIQAFDTTGWPPGTVFVGEGSNLGTRDLSTGKITSLGLATPVIAPKGLLFVPASDHQDG